MGSKATIKVGHIQITDHLILGVSNARAKSGDEPFEKLELEPVCYVDWNEVKDALSDGEIDAAFMLSPMAMTLFRTGLKIKLVLLGHKNGSILCKNNSANVNNLQDFKGKEVIIPHQLSIHNMLFHKMLAKEGLSAGAGKDVLLEVIAPSLIPEMIEKYSQLAGFIVAEPFGSQVIKSGKGSLLALSKDVWPDHPCCVLVARDEVVTDKKEALQELVSSLVKAGNYIEDNPEDAAKIGADFLEQDEEVIRSVLTEPKDRITTCDLMPVSKDLNEIQNYMTDEMDNGMYGKIDLGDFIDDSFAKNAGAT